MAYLDTSHEYWYHNAVAVPMPEDFQPAPAEVESFQPTEWTVIALARHDSLATLREPHRSKLGRLFLGQPRNYQLSDERLEALRRLAVEAWHQPLAIALPALGRFIAAGFSSAQLALLMNKTGALRAIANQDAVPVAAAMPVA